MLFAYTKKSILSVGVSKSKICTRECISPDAMHCTVDFHADSLGVAVFQDMPQKFHVDDPNATVALFEADLRALVLGPRANHPSILSWDIFNEHG